MSERLYTAESASWPDPHREGLQRDVFSVERDYGAGGGAYTVFGAGESKGGLYARKDWTWEWVPTCASTRQASQRFCGY